MAIRTFIAAVATLAASALPLAAPVLAGSHPGVVLTGVPGGLPDGPRGYGGSNNSTAIQNGGNNSSGTYQSGGNNFSTTVQGVGYRGGFNPGLPIAYGAGFGGGGAPAGMP